MDHIRHLKSHMLKKMGQFFHPECWKVFQESLECFTWRCTQGYRQARGFSAWTSTVHNTWNSYYASLYSSCQTGSQRHAGNLGAEAGWLQQAVYLYRQGITSVASRDGCGYWSVVGAGPSHPQGYFSDCMSFTDFFPNKRKSMETSFSFLCQLPNPNYLGKVLWLR